MFFKLFIWIKLLHLKSAGSAGLDTRAFNRWSSGDPQKAVHGNMDAYSITIVTSMFLSTLSSTSRNTKRHITEAISAGMFFKQFIWITLLHLQSAGSAHVDTSLFKTLSNGEAVQGNVDETVDCSDVATATIKCLTQKDCIALLKDSKKYHLVRNTGPSGNKIYASTDAKLWTKHLYGSSFFPTTLGGQPMAETTTRNPSTIEDVQTTTQCGTLQYVGVGTTYKCTRVLSSNSGWDNKPGNTLITVDYCLEIATLETECIDTVGYNSNNNMCFMYSCNGDYTQVEVVAKANWKLYSVFGQVPHDSNSY